MTPPVCAGGLKRGVTCDRPATVICSVESRIPGAPLLQWYSCDDPEHQEGGSIRRITKPYASADFERGKSP